MALNAPSCLLAGHGAYRLAMISTNDIRRSFLEYFGSQGHDVVPSAPLVPYNDPTLMFTNAGMVPFKNVFTGLKRAPSRAPPAARKCVRAAA
jgi:alanyl-tRNA synthetase